MNHPAQFVGSATAELRRNLVTLYRRDFVLTGEPSGPAWLHLFADSRYRLWVNGEFAAAGPARFVTQFPEYDSVDVSRWLHAGENCLVVEAHAYGGSSFQTMPDGREGLIAWGVCGAVEFSTPGEWRMRKPDAWDETAALFAFAQNAAESCDTRRLDPAWYLPGKINAAGWSAARVLTEGENVWGRLAPRSAPMPSFRLAEPKRVAVGGTLANDVRMVGFHFPETFMGPAQKLPKGLRQVFQTWIHSPKEQEIALGQHWGEYWLNGEPAVARPWPGYGMRSEKIVRVKAGWNCFCGHVEFLGTSTEFWDCVLGVPRDAGVRLSAWPREGVSAVFALAGELVPTERLGEWLVDGRPVERAGWREHDGSLDKVTPARVLGWQRWAEVTVRDLPYAQFDGTVDAAGSMWNFDFGEEALGHVFFDIEGAPGQVVEVGYDDWQMPSGDIALYRSNPFAHTAERYVLRGGRQRIVGLNPRGGHFLQVAVYPAPDDAKGTRAKLHGFGVRETKTLELGEATFRTNASLDAKIWKSGVMTLIGSTEDAYSDSPWRERGTYIGDFTVNQMVQRLVTVDMRVARRAMRVFAQAQLENGQLPGVAPAWHRRAHEDFTLIWVIGLWEHWAMTGDTAVVAELWPAVERIWASTSWKADADGLWAAEGLHCFVDWGIVKGDREGEATGVLNAFRVAALEKCAELAHLIGKEARADELRSEAKRVREAFARVLWLPDQGRYAACRKDGVLSDSAAKHANLLAWSFRIGTDEHLAAVEKHLFAALDDNYAFGVKHGQFNGHIELYFFRFLLVELAERGHGARALSLVRQHWGPFLEDDFATLPECFCRFATGVGSRCHSWSGHPSVWYTNWVLGLRQEAPGVTDRWVLDPVKLEGITEAEGVLPHARGLIRVKWTRGVDGKIKADVRAPDGVVVAVRP